MHWLEQAKKLPYGQRTKIVCCSADRSCLITHDQKGYRAWCFRCDPQDPIRFVPHGLRSIAELSAIRLAQQTFLQTGMPSGNKQQRMSGEDYLPKDVQVDPVQWPGSMHKWLLSAGIPVAISTAYGFGYSQTLSRCVLPLKYRGISSTLSGEIPTSNERSQRICGCLLRSLDRAIKPKYLLKHEDAENAVFLADSSHVLPSAQNAGTLDAFDLVVTEDVLSAIRVGRHTTSGALLGTGVGAGRIQSLLGRTLLPTMDTSFAMGEQTDQNHVIRIGIWMDPDNAGFKARRKLFRSLTMQGHTCTIIRSEKDPKFYSDNQIRSILLARHSSLADT